MTKERIQEISNQLLIPYMFESHKWCDIKDYLIMNLPVDDSTEIICEIERYNKGTQKFSPRDDRYYYIYIHDLNDGSHEINLKRDREKSPLSDFEKERNRKMDYRYKKKMLNS